MKALERRGASKPGRAIASLLPRFCLVARMKRQRNAGVFARCYGGGRERSSRIPLRFIRATLPRCCLVVAS